MSGAAYIAGDWGTSNLRLFLCADDDRVLATANGPGAAESRGRFAEVFDGLTAAWRKDNGALPAVLCGMAGSAFGWVEAPYLSCPEEVASVALSLATPRAGVHIVPGMRCSNPLGALTQAPALATGRQLVCLPGTHSKWVSLHDGVVLDFLTVPTGELFKLLCDHSVLVREPTTRVEHRAAEFERGLAESARHAEVPLLHRLFQARSLRLDKQLSPEGAPSWMSGLLIGSEVGGALPLFAAATTVHVIGAPALCDLYRAALAKHGRRAECIAGDTASLAGLARVRAALPEN